MQSLVNMVVYQYEEDRIARVGMANPVEFNKLDIVPIRYKLVDMSLCYIKEIVQLFKDWYVDDVACRLKEELDDDDIYALNNN